MHRRLVLPASAFLLLLTPPHSIAAAPPGPAKVLPIVQPGFAWPKDLGTGNFGRAEAAQITEDMVLDVVALRGPTAPAGAVDDLAVLLYGPSNHRGVIPLPKLVADFAIVAGAGPHGRDAIALLDAHGLSLATVDDGANQFTITSLASPAFLGAVRLRAADCDRDGDCDILGLRADAKALLVAENTRSGFIVRTLPIPAGLIPTDFAPVDAKKPMLIEFALLDPFGLAFVATNPTWSPLTTLRVYRTEKSQGSLATLRAHPLAPQRVAWVTGESGTAKQSLLVADAEKLDAGLVTFAGEGIVTLWCADLDRDGDDDATLARTALAGALALFSPAAQGGGAFSSESELAKILIPADVPALPEPAQHAWPVLGDLDNDGDREVLIACEGSGIVGLIEGATFPAPVLGFDGPPPIPSIANSGYKNDPDNGFNATGSADLGIEFVRPDGLGSDFRLEVVVWREPAFHAPVEPDAVAFAHLPVLPGPQGGSTIKFKFDVAEAGAFPFSAILWIESRFVRVDPADGRILESFPASVYGFAAAEFAAPGNPPIGPSITPLVAEPDSGPMIPVLFVFPTAGAVQCGGLVPKAAVPYFPSGPTIPRTNGSTQGGQGPGGGG